MRKTGIIHPRLKSVVESNACWGVKFSSWIFVNDYEATKGMVHLCKGAQAQKLRFKNIVDSIFVYRSTSDQLLSYFRTVLDVLKHHRDTLNMKECKIFNTGTSLYGWMWQHAEHNLHIPK